MSVSAVLVFPCNGEYCVFFFSCYFLFCISLVLCYGIIIPFICLMKNGVTNVIESLSFNVSNSWGGSRISKSGVRTNGSPKVDPSGRVRGHAPPRNLEV